jgi:nucleotide-binding universal stress UspA family protein
MTIVVGYDGRREGRDALALAAALAPTLGEDLLVASVYPSPETSFGLTPEELRDQGERMAAEGVSELPEGVDATPVAVPGHSAAEGLYRLLESEHPSMAVVGSSHRGPLGSVLAGRVASRLLTASPCPIAVAPRGLAMRERPVLREIGIGFDDTPESWNAVQRAAAVGIAAGARLRIIHALAPVAAPPMAPAESERLTRELRAQREHALQRAAASVSKDLHAESTILVGDPVGVLEREAGEGLDLLVLGSRGYGPVHRVLLGGVSESVVRRSPCPVLVVPRSVEFDPSAGGLAAHDRAAPAPQQAGHAA